MHEDCNEKGLFRISSDRKQWQVTRKTGQPGPCVLDCRDLTRLSKGLKRANWAIPCTITERKVGDCNWVFCRFFKTEAAREIHVTLLDSFKLWMGYTGSTNAICLSLEMLFPQDSSIAFWHTCTAPISLKFNVFESNFRQLSYQVSLSTR